MKIKWTTVKEKEKKDENPDVIVTMNKIWHSTFVALAEVARGW